MITTVHDIPLEVILHIFDLASDELPESKSWSPRARMHPTIASISATCSSWKWLTTRQNNPQFWFTIACLDASQSNLESNDIIGPLLRYRRSLNQSEGSKIFVQWVLNWDDSFLSTQRDQYVQKLCMYAMNMVLLYSSQLRSIQAWVHRPDVVRHFAAVIPQLDTAHLLEWELYLAAMGVAYGRLLIDRDLLLMQMHAYAASDDPEIKATTRRCTSCAGG